ncbi:MAG: molybdopterin-dependent oxidoreductase [Nitrospirae bacterium]|nr:molybdopterin-dependent oxidoreductase [Candidatus Troglogloeales bacterium]MBI3598976.1 molybdopterin-dependent oxidoreductase [Candidatus Troglogloeales bacterium]
MIILDRRAFLRAATVGVVSMLSPQSGSAANLIAKKFLALPPKKTPFITPNNQFYIVQCCGVQKVDVNNWSLPIAGLVEKPLRLTYVDFLKRPSIEKMVTLQCIDNEVSGELISNAVWKGVSLASLLQEAKPSDLAQDVIFYGADDYSDSIPLDRALNYDVFLAYQMNGVPLPKEHGFPLRAVVPGLYGIKNVKWLTKIELVGRDYLGYWQKKGWTDEGTIKVKSRIDAPGPYNTIKGNTTFRGVAFSGYSGIRSVKITFNGGQTWTPTRLLPTPSPYSWVFWEYEWKNPKPGNYQVAVKAEDKIGRSQTDFEARPFPDGTSGLHSIVTFVD